MMKKCLTRERLTWSQIKEQYPHQYVALSQIQYGINKATVDSAIVLYTDKEKSYEDLLNMYLKGEVLLRYTTLDEDEVEGVVK